MKRIAVTKEITFDCAHMLAGHKGLCKNVHGHTYKVHVTVSAPELISEGSSEGMVIDFKDLKRILNDGIVDRFDHAFVTWDDTPYEEERAIAHAIESQGCKVVRTCYRPSAENMAYYFYQGIAHELTQLTEDPEFYQLESVRVWETPTSFAEYKGIEVVEKEEEIMTAIPAE